MHKNETDSHGGRTYVVTGADTGIGHAVAALLARRGARVIRCGIGEEMEVRADLTKAGGRGEAADRIGELAGGALDGLALVAGTATGSPAVRLNYFGTVALLTALRERLAQSSEPRAVVMSSASSLSAGDTSLVEACLAGDEGRATRIAAGLSARGRDAVVYRSTKIALNRWLRCSAGHADWAGRGILLNAVAPGIVDTATARRDMLGDPAMVRVLSDALPQPLGMPGPVEPVAAATAWLLSRDAAFTTGQVLFVDGGAEVLLRGDEPFSSGVRYGPLRMLRMIFWSAVARARGRA